jgi:hypothetical protein
VGDCRWRRIVKAQQDKRREESRYGRETQVDQHDFFLLDEVVPRPRQVSSRRFRLLLDGLLPGLRAQDAGVRLSG